MKQSWSRKFLVGSEFDIHKAESSQKQPKEAPSLGMRRDELSRQHVRALNTQFASWVQTQFQNHPDELWEDGIQDYINHDSCLKHNGSDVVDWLKVKSAPDTQTAPNKLLKENNKTSFFGIPPASTTASFAMSWSNPSQNNIVSESKDNNEIKKMPEKPGFASSGASAGFPVSWGNPMMKLSSQPSVKKSEEKGVTVVHEMKCKLYVKVSTQLFLKIDIIHIRIKMNEFKPNLVFNIKSNLNKNILSVTFSGRDNLKGKSEDSFHFFLMSSIFLRISLLIVRANDDLVSSFM
ncbi:hypothetical protein DCAR_0519841 [Daucus carota subsp. sativus]|uniref:Uncharacterized protein n=1 Tax=Daucus carota subsp. sativus TaxID=79200 RepID=A0AAF0X322_DAUCS|nr:hypothetical protein DCAR_0519841 [Daucus carota subsp. sativus]